MTAEGLAGSVAVVVGGTDGIGAATAMELCKRGARVIVIGRSARKAEQLVDQCASFPGTGSIETIASDLSEMRTVEATADSVASLTDRIDLLVLTVGILLTKPEYTSEGLEKDFAVSYLARFAFLEAVSSLGLLTAGTRMVNVAASNPRLPRYARMEFQSLAEVRARVGMKAHGQAQLANDLLTAQAASRYGVTAIGYGPGSVRTNIRREINPLVRAVMRPFFAFKTRDPAEVGTHIVQILQDPGIAQGSTSWFNSKGSFSHVEPSFVADARRQRDLLNVSLALTQLARGH